MLFLLQTQHYQHIQSVPDDVPLRITDIIAKVMATITIILR